VVDFGGKLPVVELNSYDYEIYKTGVFIPVELDDLLVVEFYESFIISNELLLLLFIVFGSLYFSI
jgi:hypothetical protein